MWFSTNFLISSFNLTLITILNGLDINIFFLCIENVKVVAKDVFLAEDMKLALMLIQLLYI